MADTKSLPPNDLAAESCALASFLLGDAQIRADILRAIPRRDAFFCDLNAIIFDSLVAMAEREDPIDAVSVAADLTTRGELEHVGGLAAIGSMISSVPSPSNGAHYAKIVRTKWQQRWSWKLFDEAARECWIGSEDVIAVLRRAHSKIDGVLLKESAQRSTRAGGAEELEQAMRQTVNGARRTELFSIHRLSRQTQALSPETITLVAGPPGDGKTFLMLDSMNEWFDRGIRFAMLAIEGSRRYLLNRCLAIRTGDARLLNNEQTERMGELAISRYEEHRETLEKLGECIFDPSHVETSLGSIARWIDEQCRTNRIVVVDPITLADKGERAWIDDMAFIKSVDRSVQKTGAAVVLVTHPKDTLGKPVTLHSIPGGKSFINAAQTVLAMTLHKPKDFIVVGSHGLNETVRGCNRTMTVLKARNGANCKGMQYAMKFNPQSLRFEEFGAIVEEEKSHDVPDVT